MRSQGHVTTASLKQANKKINSGAFFIRLHLQKICASILQTSHSKLEDPKQYDVKASS